MSALRGRVHAGRRVTHVGMDARGSACDTRACQPKGWIHVVQEGDGARVRVKSNPLDMLGFSLGTLWTC